MTRPTSSSELTTDFLSVENFEGDVHASGGFVDQVPKGSDHDAMGWGF
jgi:hypothetical protein